LLVEEGQVQRFQCLKVVLSLLVSRGVLAVHEVVVQRDGEGPDAVGQQLDGEPPGEGGLAGRGGAGNQHQPDAVVLFGDGVGNLGDALFVQCLGDQDNLPDASVLNGGVQVPHIFHAQQPQPFPVFLEDGVQPGGIRVREQLGGPVPPGVLEDEPRRRGAEGKILEVPGGGHHVAVKVVLVIPQAVEDEVIFPTAGEKADFVLLAPCLEEGEGFFNGHPFLADGHVFFHDAPHVGLNRPQFFRREGFPVEHPAVEAAGRDGVVYDDLGFREEFGDGSDQQEGEGAPVDAHPVRIGEEDGGDLGVPLQRVGQLPQFPVHQRGDDGDGVVGVGGAHVGLYGRPHRRFPCPPVRKGRLSGLARSG